MPNVIFRNNDFIYFASYSQSFLCDGNCSSAVNITKCKEYYPHGFTVDVNGATHSIDHGNHVAQCGSTLSSYTNRHKVSLMVADAPPSFVSSPIIVRDFQVHGINARVLTGACPMFTDHGGGTYVNLFINCTNTDQPAIEIKGKNVKIFNVNVTENGFLVRAIDDYHIDVGDLRIENSFGTIVLGNIASGNVNVVCTEAEKFFTLVVAQRTQNFVTTNCPLLSLDSVIDPLGTQYEIDYNYRNAEVNPYNQIFRWGVFLLLGIAVVLLLYTLITREQQLQSS